MNYVGKFFSNFKGFYNDINSATLTGAIDILVVKQEDGSYATSPWHVRFGKMGVIRAREKVVDIEINGEPVQLYMKLGEAGEAFFVHEAENQLDVPIYLSTSPINTCTEFLNQVDSDVRSGSNDASDLQCAAVASDFLDDGLCDKQCDTVITIDGDNITLTEVPKAMTTNLGAVKKESVTMDNNHYFVSHSSSVPTHSFCQPGRATVATQTEMLGSDVEAKKCKSRNVSGELFGSRSQSPFQETIVPIASISVAEAVTKASDEKVVPLLLDKMPKESQVTPVACSPLLLDEVDQIGSVLEQDVAQASDVDFVDDSMPVDETVYLTPSADVAHLNFVNAHSQKRRKHMEEIFDLELSDDETVERAELHDMEQAKRKLEAELNEGPEDWTRNPFACNSHPFSDTDITPGTSPLGSRPPSPKSDTEYETQKYDATAQTQLTGDELMLLDDIKWEWGEFPQPSPLPAKLPSSACDNVSKKEDKPSGGLFQFMRKTKKLRHQPLEEGIYLEDLNLAEMDPEVAALYLYNPKSSQLSVRQCKDEDSESGQGLSLPHSPVTFEQETSPSSLTESEKTNFSDTKFSDVALSLCGGLQDIEQGVMAEQFTKHLIPFENFCDNPNLLTDPNLVVRLNGRFYNWAAAGPMIMSVLVFNQPLVQGSVELLIKQHMPKKERRRGLWWWSRGTQVTTNSEATSNPQAVGSSASAKELSSNSMVKSKTKPRKSRGREGSTSGDESDMMSQTAEEKPTIAPSTKAISRDKYVKSLKLTSEQLASLNLKNGANEVSFSVTTQYQGTSRCHCFLYLWNWDDRIIVSDIDGTITRSDVWGQVLPMIGKDWSQAGIANLYSMISSNGYKFLYLSARAIGQSRITRDYLLSVRQGDLYLPEGPLLLSPSSLLSAFYKEVIERKPEEFKIGCLRDISALFPPTRSPLYAGFGNKINDTFAYRTVGIPIARIFTVNPKGELSMGLSFQSSYTKLSDIVDHFFPPLLHCHCHHEVVESGKFPGATEYSDFTYWRENLPDIQDELTRIVNTNSVKNATKKNQEQSRDKLRQSSKKGNKK